MNAADLELIALGIALGNRATFDQLKGCAWFRQSATAVTLWAALVEGTSTAEDKLLKYGVVVRDGERLFQAVLRHLRELWLERRLASLADTLAAARTKLSPEAFLDFAEAALRELQHEREKLPKPPQAEPAAEEPATIPFAGPKAGTSQSEGSATVLPLKVISP